MADNKPATKQFVSKAYLIKQERLYKALLEQQHENFKSFIQVVIDNTNKRVDDLISKFHTEVEGLKHSLEYTQGELDSAKIEIAELSKQQKDPELFEPRLQKCEEKLDYQENQSRRNNIVIDGLKESVFETWSDTEKKVREVLEKTMKFKPGTIEIERAHRIKNSSKHPRPVVAKLLRYQDREAILKNGPMLKKTGIFISDDVSERIQTKRKELLPKLKEARSNGKLAYFVMDRLVVKDRKPRPQHNTNYEIGDVQAESTRDDNTGGDTGGHADAD